MVKLEPAVSEPARAIKAARMDQGLSIRDLAARAGMPFSTVSKLENGKMVLTYDKLVRLAQGLNIDLGILVSGGMPSAPSSAVGRRSVARAGEYPEADSDRHHHLYPAAEMRGKMMVPVIITVSARTVDEMGGLVRHVGEEYLYVLSGSMDLHSDLYEPLPLGEGDSIYFDSGMAHAYVNTGPEPCRVLSVCAGRGMHGLAQSVGRSTRAAGVDARDRGASGAERPGTG